MASRVVQRYRQVRAASDEAALDALADHWVDVFLDEFESHANLTEDTVEKVLTEKGISAGKVNELVGEDATKEASGAIKALGGWILKGIWHMILGPFVTIGKLIKSSEFRAEIKTAFKRALKHEVRATKHMFSVAGRMARGEEVRPQEKKAAMMQLVDILTKTVLIYFAGPHVAHLFSGGIWKILGTLLSPLDEILVILLDKPIRAAAKKLLSSDLGLLPSGFYTHF